MKAIERVCRSGAKQIAVVAMGPLEDIDSLLLNKAPDRVLVFFHGFLVSWLTGIAPAATQRKIKLFCLK